jgi:hypothetical protein
VLYQLSYSHRFLAIIATEVRAVRTELSVVRVSKKSLVAADTDVLESHGAQTG